MGERAKDILHRHGLKPKDSWGQNFLDDDDALEAISDTAAVGKGDVVVELGPGLGHLTRYLVGTGARVVAVERDRDMVRVLEGLKIEGLTVVAGNAAETDFAKVGGAQQVVVVGNLPYHLTASILFEVLDQVEHVQRAVFTLQKEVVERLSAAPGGREYGLLTVLLGLRFSMTHAATFPAHLFHPAPKVDSTLIRLDRLEAPRAVVKDEARFRKLVKASFAQRRKTLSNSVASDRQLDQQYDLKAAIARAGIDGKRRAETLSVEEFAALERALDG
jgi:16S rRNA (adenine1518-N6/adenine1519-N6)-dimethyltransferase